MLLLQVLGQLYREVRDQAAEAKQALQDIHRKLAAAGKDAFDPDFVPASLLGSAAFAEELDLALVSASCCCHKIARLRNMAQLVQHAIL